MQSFSYFRIGISIRPIGLLLPCYMVWLLNVYLIHVRRKYVDKNTMQALKYPSAYVLTQNSHKLDTTAANISAMPILEDHKALYILICIAYIRGVTIFS